MVMNELVKTVMRMVLDVPASAKGTPRHDGRDTYTIKKWQMMRNIIISILASQLYVGHLIFRQCTRSSKTRARATHTSQAAGLKPMRIWKILYATSPPPLALCDSVKKT